MGALNLVITGAAGFLGRQVVSAALARGHTVRAVVRRPESVPATWTGAVTPVLRDVAALDAAALAEADAVIHLAAAMAGDAATQHRDTVEATRALCTAMAAMTPAPRLVLVSSMSVYAHDAVPPGGILREDSAVEREPRRRELYCQNKILQEEVAQEFAARGLPLTVLRPGAIYGPGQVWNGHLGVLAGPVLVQFSTTGQIPAVNVRNAAQAIVIAYENRISGPVNLLDCPVPDRAAYLAAAGIAGRRVQLPWRLVAGLGRLLAFWPGRPGLLRPEIIRARMMPVRYDCAGMRALMADQPMAEFAQAMQEARI